MGLYSPSTDKEFIDEFVRIYIDQKKQELDNILKQMLDNGMKEVRDDLDNINAVKNDLENIDKTVDNLDNINLVANNYSDINNYSITYQGAKSTDPIKRNNGDDLQKGDLYFNTTENIMKVFDGSLWQNTGTSHSMIMNKQVIIADGLSKSYKVLGGYDPNQVEVRLNGSTLICKPNIVGTVDVSDGKNVVFDYIPRKGAIIEVISWFKFYVADTYTKDIIDAKQIKLITSDKVQEVNDDFLAKDNTAYIINASKQVRCGLPKNPEEFDTIVIIDLFKHFDKYPVVLHTTTYMIDGAFDDMLLDEVGKEYKIMFYKNQWRVI